jgi:hypothetical protein
MKLHTQLEQLVSEIKRHGALMDDLVESTARISVDVPYPPLFSSLLKNHSFAAFDLGDVRIFSNIQEEEDNLEDLLHDKNLTDALVGAGFSPFGRPVTGSYDRVCFDMRESARHFETPVVLMDHESILSNNRIPKPIRLADSLMQLLERAGTSAT